MPSAPARRSTYRSNVIWLGSASLPLLNYFAAAGWKSEMSSRACLKRYRERSESNLRGTIADPREERRDTWAGGASRILPSCCQQFVCVPCRVIQKRLISARTSGQVDYVGRMRVVGAGPETRIIYSGMIQFVLAASRWMRVPHNRRSLYHHRTHFLFLRLLTDKRAPLIEYPAAYIKGLPEPMALFIISVKNSSSILKVKETFSSFLFPFAFIISWSAQLKSLQIQERD